VPLRISGRILADVLSGLHAAHELKDADGLPLQLVHRDISPHNILLGIDGITRITDFGIAKSASSEGSTKTGVIKGKIRYMAPEQAIASRIDRRTDVWAAGVVAWELLANRRLYESDNEAAILLRIIQQPVPPLSELRPDLPHALSDAVMRALTTDANSRFATADEFRSALIDAWQNVGGLADYDEVGRHIRAGVEPPPVAEPTTHD
jgi:serine/threonine-protein kinase